MIVSPEGELVATRRGVTSSSWAEPRVKSLFILGSKIGIETVSILGRDCRAPRALTFDKFGEGGNAEYRHSTHPRGLGDGGEESIRLSGFIVGFAPGA
jgi:hypothetical protein